MTSSGTTAFQLSNADVLLEAFDRIGLRPPAITAEHMISAKRSLNLELQAWSNLGLNLWAIDQQTIPLIQGVTTYNIPTDTVTMLDTYVRLFQLPNAFNVSPIFTTTINSAIVTVVVPNHGLLSGYWTNFVTQVAVGGLLLYGFYQANTIIDNNTFTIIAGSNATSTVVGGGTLPTFTAEGGSSIMSVTLANHGLTAGQLFVVGASTLVGGVTLFGSYTVAGVVSSSIFTISLPQEATSSQTVIENGGLFQITCQTASVLPVDRILLPLSRSDYAMIPNKTTQAPPTSYWYDRIINQTVTLWQVPDGNGPYALYYYRMRRLQDANPSMGETPDVQYRFQDALCAGVAVRLAVKYAEEKILILQQDKKEAWSAARIEDRERVDVHIRPDFSSYYQQ